MGFSEGEKITKMEKNDEGFLRRENIYVWRHWPFTFFFSFFVGTITSKEISSKDLGLKKFERF